MTSLNVAIREGVNFAIDIQTAGEWSTFKASAGTYLGYVNNFMTAFSLASNYMSQA
jgi:hypothetical protein